MEAGRIPSVDGLAEIINLCRCVHLANELKNLDSKVSELFERSRPCRNVKFPRVLGIKPVILLKLNCMTVSL